MSTPLVAATVRSASSRHAEVELEVRRLVARELHDRVAQILTEMLVDVENFKSEQASWQDVLRQLEGIQSSTRQVLTSLRQLLHDLRGEETLAGGLVDLVRALAVRFQARTGIAVTLEVAPGWPTSLAPATSLNVYRIVEEALANVRQHSGAQNVSIALRCESEEELGVRVADDGRGLDVDPERPEGLGTIGMKERALLLGGRVVVQSAPGCGTTVVAAFPTRQNLAAEEKASPKVLIPEGMTA